MEITYPVVFTEGVIGVASYGVISIAIIIWHGPRQKHAFKQSWIKDKFNRDGRSEAKWYLSLKV